MTFVGRSRVAWLGALVSGIVLAIPAQIGGIATASTINIFSFAGTGTNNVTGTNVAVTPAPGWALPPAGSQWISYAVGTGFGGSAQPGAATPPLTGANATAVFYQTFTITDPSDSGTLYVWADDTATVWIDPGTISSGDGSGGSMLIAADPVEGPGCANAPISCTTGNEGALPVTLSTGTYTLVIDTYQRVSATPFGVMYSGTLTSTAPEPANYMLLGVGLAGLGVLLRRRKRA